MRGHVDLDPVAEPEQALGALAEPDERVERHQQRPALRPTRDSGARDDVRRLGPTGDRDLEQVSRLHQLLHARSRRRDLQPEVVGKVRKRGHPAAAGGDQEELPVRLIRRRCRQVEDGAWDDAFGEVVDPLEVASIRRGDEAGVEQILQDGLLPRPVPAPVLLGTVLLLGDVACRDRTLVAHDGQHVVDEPRRIAQHSLDVTPAVDQLLSALHLPTPQRMHRDRQQSSLVAPVLEQLPVAICHPVQRLARVRADARPRGQIVRAREDVDAVDLQGIRVLKHATQMPAVGDTSGAWSVQSLGRERDPPRLAGRQPLHARILPATTDRGQAAAAQAVCANDQVNTLMSNP